MIVATVDATACADDCAPFATVTWFNNSVPMKVEMFCWIEVAT